MAHTVNHKPLSVSYIVSTVISRVFDPFIVLAGVTGLSIWESSLTISAKYAFSAIVLAVMILPPAALLAWAVMTKRVSNWDMSDRSDRPLALLILFFLGFVNILIVESFGDPSLTNLFIIYQLWLSGFLGITLLWKISGHTGTLALATGIAVLRYGLSVWIAVAVVGILGIARVVRKNHSPAQAILGACYSWGILLFARSIGLV